MKMIKKTIIISLIIINIAYAVSYPVLKGYVTDDANIISPEYESQISRLISEIEKETTAEIAIVTVPSLEGIAKETYATELFERAGIGKKDKDNGLLILIALQEREYRVEVGYGLEGLIPDSSKVTLGTRILEPNFKEGNFGKGIYEALLAIQKILQGQNEVLSQYSQRNYQQQVSSLKLWIFIIFFILIIIMSIFGRRRRYGFYPILIPGPRWNKGTGSFGTSGFGGFSGGLSGGGGFGGRF